MVIEDIDKIKEEIVNLPSSIWEELENNEPIDYDSYICP